MATISNNNAFSAKVTCMHCGKELEYVAADVRFLDIEKDGIKTAKNTIICGCPLRKIVTV